MEYQERRDGRGKEEKQCRCGCHSLGARFRHLRVPSMGLLRGRQSRAAEFQGRIRGQHGSILDLAIGQHELLHMGRRHMP